MTTQELKNYKYLRIAEKLYTILGIQKATKNKNIILTLKRINTPEWLRKLHGEGETFNKELPLRVWKNDYEFLTDKIKI